MGFNITRSTKVAVVDKIISVNHAPLSIIIAKQNQTAFDELKFNSTIVTYLLPYITGESIKDFTHFWTPCMQCLKLTRYTHWYQCVYLVKAVRVSRYTVHIFH